MPPLLLTMQVLLRVTAGFLGIFFATPLTAAAMVLVKKWHVEDLLRHREAPAAIAPPQPRSGTI